MPPAKAPPTLGGFIWYWACSRPLTTQPSPLDRAHSASRAEVVSVPGAVRAPPIDQVSHSAKTTVSTPTRRIQKRRRLGRAGRRYFGGSSSFRSPLELNETFPPVEG